VTLRPNTAPQEQAQTKKNKSPSPRAYPRPSLPSPPHFFVFIRRAQSSVAAHPSTPSPARAHRAAVSFPFPIAGHATRPHSLRHSPVWQPPVSLGVAAHPSAPFHSALVGLPRHALPPSPVAPLTCIAVTTSLALSPFVRRPLPLGVSLPCHGR
jgi:hypothetical protein